jgi:hypothetical protein
MERAHAVPCTVAALVSIFLACGSGKTGSPKATGGATPGSGGVRETGTGGILPGSGGAMMGAGGVGTGGNAGGAMMGAGGVGTGGNAGGAMMGAGGVGKGGSAGGAMTGLGAGGNTSPRMTARTTPDDCPAAPPTPMTRVDAW